MKIITFSASKGGVGKTTLSFNFGSWLAHNGHKVLLIDSDYQSNLSSTFDVFSPDHTLMGVFTDGQTTIRKINDNLSLLPASVELDKVEVLLQQKMFREYMMMGWLSDHLEEVKPFDYVIIDTHPEFGLLTKNMIAVSDYVLVPIEPSEYGFQQSRNQFEMRMHQFQEDSRDPRTGEVGVEAQVFYIANRIKHNTSNSRTFTEVISQMPEVIAQIPERELMNSSTLFKTPVVDMTEDFIKKHGNHFKEQLFTEFEKMKQKIDGNEEK